MPSVTPMPTAGYLKAEAARETAARVAAQDTAAVAQAEAFRYARAGVYNLCAADRYGATREQVVAAFNNDAALVDVLLSALVADGDLIQRGALFSIPQVAA